MIDLSSLDIDFIHDILFLTRKAQVAVGKAISNPTEPAAEESEE
jgi:hypothetical protein